MQIWKALPALLAPYGAVLVFWCGLSLAWPAILAYHALILLLAREHACCPPRPGGAIAWLALGPALLAGPILYFCLPHMLKTDLSIWLADHGLSTWSLWLMIPYFGLIHPLLEQMHWRPLRARTAWAHVFFAGYHLPVLYSLIAWPWLAAAMIVLALASRMWRELDRRGRAAASIPTHMAADLGIVIAAWLRAAA